MAETASEPSWLTGLDFVITDAPAGGGAASGGAVGDVPNPGGPGAGRFSLSREEAQGMLTRARSVRDRLQDLQHKAIELLQIKAPADDPSSVSYNSLLVGGQGTGAFASGNDQVTQELKYASDLVQALEKALGLTVTADEQAGTDVKNAAAGQQNTGLA
ncbi:hypothetical protein [Amycolatopsis sp. DSM 110486]|uniref:hypothetical protein n=1 Tax=Amycolatopsis sp. DSM 110486 TaxID=2865832 RepID=UPI001C69C27A|nr:hypothetical protein [Amycolatopsis sp. DSM 110486]QYN24442.1 hypothetical protein K1T34_19555 [Amycolatopsis sp. DSM 110486]